MEPYPSSMKSSGVDWDQALEAFQRYLAIERNYSPLWSIWRSESNGKTGATSQSFLWNLYRRDTTPTSKKCSLLFGLFHYHSGPDGSRWRVFYIPLGKTAKRPGESAAQASAQRYVPEHR